MGLMETYLSTAGKGKAHGTYYLARQDPQTGNQTISLISQNDLHEAIKDTTVIGYHIYSLEPSPLKDLSTLSVANSEAHQLQQGKDINIYRVVHNRDVIVTKSSIKTSTPISKAVPTKANQPAIAPSSASTILPATAILTSSSTKSKPTATASKASVMSFFGKASTSKTPATTPATSALPAKSSTLNFKPVQKRKADSMTSTDNDSNNGIRDIAEEHHSDNEVDSEEERDRRLALSSRLDQDQGDINESKSNSHTPGESTVLDVDAIKKRQRNARLLALDDDDEIEDDHYVTQKPKTEDDDGDDEDDEDNDESIVAMSKEALMELNKEKERQRQALENMMLEPDEDSPMVDVEALDQPDESSAPAEVATTHKEATPGRRRGVRAVTKRKTSRNERGYMVTEDIVEMESFSEDDVPAPASAPASIRTEKAEPSKGKQEIGGAKKKAGSGNQSLLNFFSKKQ
ncbi:hypothetical protein BGZ46_004700 [Entomortierella lignicola]|nr:hypothetical protein BGZ46_004700 [Entomortierella lignicola]